MAKLAFWDKQTDLTFPAGFRTAKDYLMEHPEFQNCKVVVGVSRGVTLSVDKLGTLCDVYGVPEELDDEAALAYIENQIAEQQRQAEEASRQPTAEERIAAAMEFQNLNIL